MLQVYMFPDVASDLMEPYQLIKNFKLYIYAWNSVILYIWKLLCLLTWSYGSYLLKGNNSYTNDIIDLSHGYLGTWPYQTPCFVAFNVTRWRMCKLCKIKPQNTV